MSFDSRFIAFEVAQLNVPFESLILTRRGPAQGFASYRSAIVEADHSATVYSDGTLGDCKVPGPFGICRG